jgi:hypothetical protein
VCGERSEWCGSDLMRSRQIVDDGFEHSLSVIQDRRTGGLRLHAAVWSGELRKCPVWTAFGTPSTDLWFFLVRFIAWLLT